MKTRITQRGLVVPVLEGLATNAGIYRIWSPLVRGSYIGSTQHLQKRAHEHWRDYQQGSATQGIRTIFSAGLEEVQFEVLEFLPDATPKFAPELLEAEAEWATKFYERGELLSPRIALMKTHESRKQGYQRPLTLKKVQEELKKVERKADFLRRVLGEVAEVA